MKIDRLIGILSILLQKDKVTAPFLAEKFEVSRRTINRDIEALCKAGIPLTTTQGQNGGISIMEGYKLSHTLLSSSDMQAVLAGLRSLDSVSGTRRYAQLMEKLSAGSSALMPGSQHILIDLSAWSKSAVSPKIELLHEAIRLGNCVSFTYYSPRGESTRRIEPYCLIFQWSSWYVWGYCEAREDFRLFKLGRMTNLHAEGPFERRNAPMPDLSPENVFPHRCQVKAVVAPEYKWRLVEEYGPDSFTTQADGKLLFSFGFTDCDSIAEWVLSFRSGIELLEPEAVREKLFAFGQELQEKYSKS